MQFNLKERAHRLEWDPSKRRERRRLMLANDKK